ncbi:dual specificity protein phosphatase 16 [Sander vitreus]
MSKHPVGPAPGPGAVRAIGAEALVALLESGLDRVVLIDSRPFVDYNASHVLEAVNVNCSKLMKRRLQQDKVQIAELLQHSAKKKLELQGDQEVVVYDQSSSDPAALSAESFLSVLLVKLARSFPSVHLLSGGFSEFSHLFPGLCEGKSTLVPSCISQPCLPVTNIGPTRILPHLYLGCQRDVLNKDLMQQNDIVYVLNASNTCPKPDFIPESHFLRVPVNDSFCEKILPWLDRSVEFIEKAKASNARVLVHCLAGISRSATIAIAYIMKRMDMSLDEAYRFVKEKRPTISPNFNFLGQLLDFEKKIKSPHGTEAKLKSVHPAESSGDVPEQPVAPEPSAPLEPLTLPCVLADAPEERLLAQALSGLQLASAGADGPEDSARLKRSFSLDIKSYGEPVGSATYSRGAGDTVEYFKPPGFKEPASKPCQFSPVQEVSEQSTPEQSPDKDEVDGERVAPPQPAPASSSGFKPPAATHNCSPLHRSGSMEENATSFLFGLSRSQQHLAKPGSAGSALKGWHSDILLGPVTVSTASLAGGWYLSSDSTRFYSASAVLSGASGASFAAYGCSHGLEEVHRRRSRQRTGDRGDSRRSWHEESSFEKQLKRRSCQMEFGDGRTDGSREEMGKVGSQSSFSGSVEIIEVS